MCYVHPFTPFVISNAVWLFSISTNWVKKMRIRSFDRFIIYFCGLSDYTEDARLRLWLHGLHGCVYDLEVFVLLMVIVDPIWIGSFKHGRPLLTDLVLGDFD